MVNRRTLGSALALACLVVAGASSLWAAGNRDRATRPQDVVLTGKLVDLQSHMTGKTPSGDKMKAAQESIRSGVPTALETEDGLIVIGMGERGPSRLLVPLALQTVELKGKLYEKDGVQYLDLASARAIKAETEEEPEAAEEEGAGDDGGEEEP